MVGRCRISHVIRRVALSLVLTLVAVQPLRGRFERG